jgi:hypothetical protein
MAGVSSKGKVTHRVHARWAVQRRGARAVCCQCWYVDIARYIGTQRTGLSSPPRCALGPWVVWQCAGEGRKRFRHYEVGEREELDAEEGLIRRRRG